MKQRGFVQRLVGILAVLLLCAVPTRANAFFDIQRQWTAQQIQPLGQREWFLETGEQAFQPEAELTRAQLAYALASYCGAELTAGDSGFSDVSAEDTYAPAIRWAAEKGFLYGSDGYFSPHRTMTYEQLSEVLIAAVNDSGTVLPRLRRRGVLFASAADCADAYLDAMYTLYRAGVFDADVQPKDTVTQAAFSVVLCRLRDACARANSRPSQQAITISHKGDCINAPENTREAFTLSDAQQFQYVETDVQFSIDGVPVLSHDYTVDRMSNGTGGIYALTLAQLQQLDFSGGMQGYVGTKIMTFQEFITFCAERYLHPYIELKAEMTEQQIITLRDMVNAAGMSGHVTWISFVYKNLEKVHKADPAAELGFLSWNPDADAIEKTKKLTGENIAYLCARYTALTQPLLTACLREGVYVEAYTINNQQDAVKLLNTSIQGITVDGMTISDLYGSKATP